MLPHPKTKQNRQPTGSSGRLVSVLALVLAVLLLAGCGQGSAGENTAGETDPETTVSGTEDAEPDSTEPESPDSEDGEPEEGEETSEETLSPSRQLAREILEDMTLEEQIYQLFVVTPEQLTGESCVTAAGEAMAQALEEDPVGGVLLFAQNIQTPDQTTQLISALQADSELGLFIAVDEEGGTVARIGNNEAMGTTAFPNMKTIGDTGEVQQAYQVGSTIGSEIARFGFNLDFAPVADVDSNPDNPVIGDRAFSTDAAAAAEMVEAAVDGFRDSGMLCTLKHFPGHGDTDTDSHLGYTELDKSLDQLRETEFVPFQAGIQAGAQFVMVAHIAVPQVTGNDLPATLSSVMTSLLKEELGFEGIVITDSMQMEAITDRYSSGEAAVLAIQAGVDMILMPENLQEAAQGLLQAVESGEISRKRIQESVLKILETKAEAGILG